MIQFRKLSVILKGIRQQLDLPFVIPDFLNKTYFPSLDGWRAVAIAIVVIGHAKLTVSKTSLFYKITSIFIYADFGVRIFFVLSGFLITSLLINEFITKGSINITYFFIKRVLRIFPVLYLYLGIVLALNELFNLSLNLDHFLGPLLYINNFNFFSSSWLTGHTWSLAVEEQFYLIWPFLFSRLTKKLWIFCLFMVLSIPFFKVLWYFNPSYYTLTAGPFIDNADAIFSGALLSILAFKKIFNNHQIIWGAKGLDLFLIFIIFICQYCVHRGYVGILFYPGSNIICNLMICMLLLRTLINTKTSLFKFLNQKIVIQLGLISYSLYIWQQLFLIPIASYQENINVFKFPFNILIALAIAYLSYHYFEKYFLNLKKKYIA